MVTAAQPPHVDRVAPLFMASCEAAGLAAVADGFNLPNRGKRAGCGYYQFNIRDGVRDGAAAAVLAPAILGEKKLPNLEVITGATVGRVLMRKKEGEAAIATGVEYFDRRDKTLKSVRLVTGTDTTVVLAGGAIMTPQILANSGIHEHGEMAQVPGVGKDLQDHPAIGIKFRLAPHLAATAPSTYALTDQIREYARAVGALRRRRKEGGGDAAPPPPLGIFGSPGLSAGSFLVSPYAAHEPSPHTNEPDLQVTAFPRVTEPHLNGAVGAVDFEEMLITIALLRPEARHVVGLNTDPDAPFHARYPSVDVAPGRAKYLTDRDEERLAWGLEEVRRIARQPPLSDSIAGETSPGADVTGDALNTFVREKSTVNSHWVGSCRMGPPDDAGAVVDAHLRVRGTEGLRIVDASVIPHIPNGNVHSTVCAVAARGVDIMLGREEMTMPKEVREGAREVLADY